jgi:hypothetical protein
MDEPLIEYASPFGNIVAVAEDDGRVVYFYLHYTERSDDDEAGPAMKACWVRNRLPAPADIDREAMEQGGAPLLPAAYCKSRSAGPPLNQEALSVVWFEECDAAALFEGNEILAVIPAWSGEGGFDGYARDCIGESPCAWELGVDNLMHERVRRAKEFWSLWDDAEFWGRWRDERIAALESTLGPHAKYYAIDSDEFPPKALLRFDLPDRYVLITVGLSLFCLPNVERHFDDPSPYRRIELAAALDRSCTAEELDRFGNYLSGQAKYPWSKFTWFGSGHTMPCDSTPASCGGRRFPAALLAQHLPGLQPLALPAFRGDPTSVLWFYTITESERKMTMDQGTERLLKQLSAAGHDGVIRKRESVVR